MQNYTTEHIKAHNRNFEGIERREERYFWILYNVVVALSSLVGDTTVLWATIRWKAIKLHRVVVVVIQQLAVCDLILSVFHVVPSVVSLLADGWVFGPLLCQVQETVDWLCFPMTGALTCVLTLSKLLIVKFPLRTGTWTRRNAHMVCGVTWLLNVISPVHVLHIFFTNSNTTFFSYVSYSCTFDYSLTRAPAWLQESAHYSMLISLAAIFIILPVSSALLLMEARKTAMRRRASLRWQGVVTVVMTTAVFIVSWIPNVLVGTTSLTLPVVYSISIWRTTQFLLNFNIMANFFIYTLTVPSFRAILREKLLELVMRSGGRHCGVTAVRVGNLPNVVWMQLDNSDLSEPGRSRQSDFNS